MELEVGDSSLEQGGDLVGHELIEPTLERAPHSLSDLCAEGLGGCPTIFAWVHEYSWEWVIMRVGWGVSGAGGPGFRVNG